MQNNHIHTYRRHRKHKRIFFCVKENCFHRMDREYLLGKQASCPGCNGIFNLGSEELRRAFPKCLKCRDTKSGKAYRAALEIMQRVVANNEKLDSTES